MTGFSASGVARMEAAMKREFAALFAPTPVALYGAGDAMINLYVGRRRGSSSEVTAGAEAEAQLATVDADDWDAKAGRPPQKGDIITWAGRRFAVEDNQLIAPTGNRVFYKCRLRG